MVTEEFEPPVLGIPYVIVVVSINGLGQFWLRKKVGGIGPLPTCGPVIGSLHETCTRSTRVIQLRISITILFFIERNIIEIVQPIAQ
jgi:hypothetical protein